MSTVRERRKSLVTPIPLGISLPPFLIEELDEVRKKFGFTRSKMIRKIVAFSLENLSVLEYYIEKENEREMSIILGVRGVIREEKEKRLPKSFRKR